VIYKILRQWDVPEDPWPRSTISPTNPTKSERGRPCWGLISRYLETFFVLLAELH